MRKAPTQDETRLLDVAAAATLLGLTDSAVRQAVYKGQIPARRFGGRVVFLRSELEHFIANLPRRDVPAPPAA
jgi:excisionase family DNA binding protein